MKKNKEKVSGDNFSGSNIITLKALDELSDFVRSSKLHDVEKFGDELSKFSRTFVKSQPNMVTLQKRVSSVVYYVKRLIKSGKTIDEIKELTVAKIDETIKETIEIQSKIKELGAKLIFSNNKILTISFSTLIREILLEAHKQNKEFEVFCLESRPVLEGQMLAQQLAQKGIETHLITDASMATFVPEMNFVFTGADRLFESGFINKIGTLPLAMITSHYNVPFHVAAETEKILKEIDRSVRFYPRDKEEILNKKVKNLNIHNYYFESIPFDYVTKIVCEDGIFEMGEFIKWYIKD